MKQAENALSSHKKVLIGEVISDKMNKTAVVRITRTIKHPLYGKIVKRFKKYKVHDEHNACKIGDTVEIIESRPLSKTKHMVLNRIVTNQMKEG
jgi:small subunit ribosomal protein S17